jgi:type II secretory pathway pseudopilin PulG
MKRGNIPFGFTIIETMIFLAVSGALLASSLLLVSGSQNKSQFNNAVRDLNRKLLK